MERLIVLGTGNAQAIHCYNTCYAMQKVKNTSLSMPAEEMEFYLSLTKLESLLKAFIIFCDTCS